MSASLISFDGVSAIGNEVAWPRGWARQQAHRGTVASRPEQEEDARWMVRIGSDRLYNGNIGGDRMDRAMALNKMSRRNY